MSCEEKMRKKKNVEEKMKISCITPLFSHLFCIREKRNEDNIISKKKKEMEERYGS
jgi:hypothetical protein